MHPSALFVPFLFVASVYGLTITSPKDGSQINPTSGSTIVSWTAVSTDPSSFELLLIDPTQKITKVLAASVETSANSFTVQNSALSAGNNWTINAMSLANSATNDAGGAILAQSGAFNVTTSTAATSGAATPTTMSTVAGAATTAAGASGTDGTATGVMGSATALNPTATNGAFGMFQVSGALVALAVVAHTFML